MRKTFLNETTTWPRGNCFRVRLPISSSSSMASTELKPNLLDWTEFEVHSWLSSIGFPQYETQIRGGRPPTLLFSQPTDRPVYPQRITSQAMSSLPSMPIHLRRLVLRRSASGFRFSSTFITSNSPITSPSSRTIMFLRVCRRALEIHVPRLTVAFCSGGGRQTGRPERR